MNSSDALFEAIKAKDTALAVQLWRESKGEGTLVSNGLTPLLMCAYTGASNVAENLMNAGAVPDIFESIALGRLGDFYRNLAMHPDLDILSTDGWTALHLAAFFGHLDMAEELIRRGATIEVRSENPQMNFALHAAIAGSAKPQMIILLISSGANVNAKAANGLTTLHLAAARGASRLIEILLENGAEEKPMDDGRFPAHLALERGHPETAKLFSVQPN